MTDQYEETWRRFVANDGDVKAMERAVMAVTQQMIAGGGMVTPRSIGIHAQYADDERYTVRVIDVRVNHNPVTVEGVAAKWLSTGI